SLPRNDHRAPTTSAVSPSPPSAVGGGCQVLRARARFAHNLSMHVRPAAVDDARAKAGRPLRPQDEVECRRCDVHCDKVVYPGACLARSCLFVYAYEEHGHTYMGCMQKIFWAEIDLEMLCAAEGRRDGFGAIKAIRRPLPMCKAE